VQRRALEDSLAEVAPGWSDQNVMDMLDEQAALGRVPAEVLQAVREHELTEAVKLAAGNRNLEPISGCDLYEYVQVINPNAFMLIPECCLWYDPRMLDDRPSGANLGDALSYADAVTDAAEAFVLDLWREATPHLAVDTPWRVMVAEKMAARIEQHTNVSNPPFEFERRVRERPISVAEKIGIEGHDDIYRMFDLGGMYKVLEEEHMATGQAALAKLRDRARERLIEYDAFLHRNYDVVNTPIRSLVGMGIGALIEGARYAKTLER